MTVTPLNGEPIVLEWAKTEEAAAVRQDGGAWKIVDMSAVQTLLEFWNADAQAEAQHRKRLLNKRKNKKLRCKKRGEPRKSA